MSGIHGPAVRIEFEGANFLTARDADDRVVIRCQCDFTDLGETEPLENFIERNGGVEGTASYLIDCYRRAA